MCPALPRLDGGAPVAGSGVSAGAGPARGEGPPPEAPAEPERARGEFGQELLDELRAAVGSEHVITHPHQLRTYESDGLLQYAVAPGAAVQIGRASCRERVSECV